MQRYSHLDLQGRHQAAGQQIRDVLPGSSPPFATFLVPLPTERLWHTARTCTHTRVCTCRATLKQWRRAWRWLCNRNMRADTCVHCCALHTRTGSPA